MKNNLIDKISYNDFFDLIKNKRVVCFGGGVLLGDFARDLEDTIFLSRVDYVVDNSPSKWGEDYEFSCGHRAMIQSPEYLRQHVDENTIILITTGRQDEIFAQLLNYHELDKSLIIGFMSVRESVLINKARNVIIPWEIVKKDVSVIPKVIHYCWFGKNPIPEKYRKWMESWRRFCPDYEIVEWNESNYDIKKNRYMKQAYDAKKWGFVPDYARLDIIYNHGGIYLDTDVELIRNWDVFLHEDGFAGMTTAGYFALGLGFGARAGLSIIKELRDEYDRLEFSDFHTKAQYYSKKVMPAPKLQTNYLKNYGFKRDGFCYQKIKGLTIYPVPVFCGKIGNEILTTADTYSIHHFDGSWMPEL